jgi:hypothetical protein
VTGPTVTPRGSHRLPDGTCCHCGPANMLRGPRWACDCNGPTCDWCESLDAPASVTTPDGDHMCAAHWALWEHTYDEAGD